MAGTVNRQSEATIVNRGNGGPADMSEDRTFRVSYQMGNYHTDLAVVCRDAQQAVTIVREHYASLGRQVHVTNVMGEIRRGEGWI